MIKNTKSMFKYAIISVIAFSHVMQIMSMDPQIGGPQSPSVRIGHTYYAGLPEAVTNAKNDDILSILKSMEIDQEIRVEGKNITIQPEGDIVLRRGYDYDGHLFNVYDDASLTLKTNLNDENSRLVIDGDWKSNFIIDKDEKQLHLDEGGNIPYVISGDGRKLYIDGTKRKLIIERSLANWIEGRILINEDLSQFVIGGYTQKIHLDTDNKVRYYKNDTRQKIVVDKFVERRSDNAAIINEGHLILNGNAIIYNNSYAPKSEYLGAVYNKKIFDMFMGYVTHNKCSGIFNDENAIFNMHGGYLLKNLAKFGGGVLNCGIFNMHHGVISSNVALNGAGVYNNDKFNMYGGIISANETDFQYINVTMGGCYGGGVYNSICSTLLITGGAILYNCSGNGGGIYNIGDLTINNTNIVNFNTISKNYHSESSVSCSGERIIWRIIQNTNKDNTHANIFTVQQHGQTFSAEQH